MIKNPTCSARDVGSIPSQGTKVPCAMEQTNPCVALVEFLCAVTTEGHTEQLLSPCAATGESVHCNQRCHMMQ